MMCSCRAMPVNKSVDFTGAGDVFFAAYLIKHLLGNIFPDHAEQCKRLTISNNVMQ